MKFLFYIVFLPFILVGMVAYGLAYIALPILLIIGVVGLLRTA